MKRNKLMPVLFCLALAAIVALSSTANAATSYWAKTTVYFNVPSDATFSIAMPANYASWQSISGTSEGGATATTDYISFNFTSGTSATLVQPYQLGATANAQAGTTKPIFYIDNTGNTNEKFEVYIETGGAPSGVQVYVNASCTGTTCTTPLTAFTSLGAGSGSANQLIAAMSTDGFLNVTLWSNTTGAASGNANKLIYIKSTAV